MKKMLLALSLSGALLGGSVTWAEESISEPTSTSTVASNTDQTVATTIPSIEPIPAAITPEAVPAAEPTVDTGDTAWVLVSTALVLLMTIPGLALFYGGMVRKKNVLSTMMYSLTAAIVVSLIWVTVGYSLAFSGSGAYIGDLSKAMLNGVS